MENLPPCEHQRCDVCMALDTNSRMMSEALRVTLAEMRRDGQGITSDQEATIRKGISLPVEK